jgi:hypothetical protein
MPFLLKSFWFTFSNIYIPAVFHVTLSLIDINGDKSYQHHWSKYDIECCNIAHNMCNINYTKSSYYSYVKQEIKHTTCVVQLVHLVQTSFDSCDHNILLHKLKLYGLSQQLYAWLEDYLSSHCQRVASFWAPVTI